MRVGSCWLGLAINLLICLVAQPSFAQLKGGNLLVAMPGGFKVGYRGSQNGMNMIEWVPVGENVQDWTEMVTVQVFLNRADIDPVQFLKKIQEGWQSACKGSTAARLEPGKVNGYAMASTVLRCPLLPATGKPETTMFRAIKGTDSFYLVQGAVRATATSERLERIKQYLASVSVCDSRAPAHPCPTLKPVGR